MQILDEETLRMPDTTLSAKEQFVTGIAWTALVVVSLSAGVFGYRWSFIQAIRSYGWAETPCVILQSHLEAETPQSGPTRPSAQRKAIRLRVLYRYKVADHTHQSERFKFSDEYVDEKGSWFHDDLDLSKAYNPGTQTSCYVNPNDPAQATLVPGLTTVMRGLVIWCVVWSGIGLTAWSSVLRRRRSQPTVNVGV
jgi:hypothetical protein